MGVHGLWKLIDAAGKPVPVETLENKILAVDVSIWLHQLEKGRTEGVLPGLFSRIAKLLFFRIKPVFVFDGGVPVLKRRTIAQRQSYRSKALRAGEKTRMLLLQNLVKQQLLGKVLGTSPQKVSAAATRASGSSKRDALFILPPNPQIEEEAEISSSEESEEEYKYGDLHSIDVNSKDFLALPADMRHGILSELNQTRKHSSWGTIHQMPEDSGNFSQFQMERLLKRNAVQKGMSRAEKEMGGRTFTLNQVKQLMEGQGVNLSTGQRIASDATTRYIFASKEEDEEASRLLSEEVEGLAGEVWEKIKEGEAEEEEIDDKAFGIESWERSEPDEKITMELSKDEELSQEQIYNMIKEENEKRGISKEIIKFNEPLPGPSSMPDLPSNTSTIPHLTSHPNPEIDYKNKLAETLAKETLKAMDKLMESEKPYKSEQKDVLSETNCLVFEKEKVASPVSSLDLVTSLAKRVQLRKSRMRDALQITSADSSELNRNVGESKETTETQAISTPEPLPIADAIEIHSLSILRNIPLDEKDHPTSISSENNIKSDTLEKGGYMSDSSSEGEFVEVEEATTQEEIFKMHGENDKTINSKKESEMKMHIPIPNSFEIIVDPKKELNESEDLFADIFSSSTTKPKITPLSVAAEKVLTCDEEMKSINLKQHEVVGFETNSTLQKPDCENVAGSHSKKQLTSSDLMEMQETLEKETSELVQEKLREDRLASTMTEQLILEAQELLQLFGVPWVTAPMEAEAQCAFLETTQQTQGTISDDSDIFLFGANNVYKNFFNQKKFVIQFKASDVERCFKLAREDLILLALLTGSDYTIGLEGVGPVTALEVLAAFPKDTSDAVPEERLKRFSKAATKQHLPHPLSKKISSVNISQGFPSREVVRAYLQPEVNEERGKFSWALPNLGALLEYTREKFGWDPKRANATLLPIMERLSTMTTQTTLHGYFNWAFKGIENEMSERVGRAVKTMKFGSSLTTSSISEGSSRKRESTMSRHQRGKRSRGSVSHPSKRPPFEATSNLQLSDGSSSEGETLTSSSLPKKPFIQKRGKKKAQGLTDAAKEARQRAAKVMAQIREEKAKRGQDQGK